MSLFVVVEIRKDYSLCVCLEREEGVGGWGERCEVFELLSYTFHTGMRVHVWLSVCLSLSLSLSLVE